LERAEVVTGLICAGIEPNPGMAQAAPVLSGVNPAVGAGVGGQPGGAGVAETKLLVAQAGAHVADDAPQTDADGVVADSASQAASEKSMASLRDVVAASETYKQGLADMEGPAVAVALEEKKLSIQERELAVEKKKVVLVRDQIVDGNILATINMSNSLPALKPPQSLLSRAYGAVENIGRGVECLLGKMGITVPPLASGVFGMAKNLIQGLDVVFAPTARVVCGVEVPRDVCDVECRPAAFRSVPLTHRDPGLSLVEFSDSSNDGRVGVVSGALFHSVKDMHLGISAWTPEIVLNWCLTASASIRLYNNGIPSTSAQGWG